MAKKTTISFFLQFGEKCLAPIKKDVCLEDFNDTLQV